MRQRRRVSDRLEPHRSVTSDPSTPSPQSGVLITGGIALCRRVIAEI
jgi:hypothetical protein